MLSEKEEKAKDTAEAFGIPILQDLSHYSFVKDRIAKLPYLFAKEKKILALEEREGKILLASFQPWQISTLKEVRLFLGKEVEIFFCPERILEEAMERTYHHSQNQKISSSINEEAGSIKDEVEGYDLLEPSSQNNVVRFLNMVLLEAIELSSSDIHFEPQEKGLHIRFRTDGSLQKRFDCSFEFQQQLISRLKVMSKLDIAEKRLPQDGRIKLKVGKRQIDFRVSTVPVIFGERIVLRLLDPENVMVGLSKLGMLPQVNNVFQKLLQMPEGIILVTGPTGSGKTTTLYSALMEMNAEELNIMTVEDPVEYKLPKIAQISISSKIQLTFSKALRHILRQDPDVVMIGEIRDKETAEIAIQAALTGHLVLTTLHTNDAPSAITRLVDIGIEPYLLSSSLLGVLAQRLVRKICVHCKIHYPPSEEEMKELNLIGSKSISRGKGCDACFHSGYKGRQGLFELMPVHTALRQQIVKNVDCNELRKAALESMITLYQSASELVRKGITSFSEAVRLIRNFD